MSYIYFRIFSSKENLIVARETQTYSQNEIPIKLNVTGSWGDLKKHSKILKCKTWLSLPLNDAITGISISKSELKLKFHYKSTLNIPSSTHFSDSHTVMKISFMFSTKYVYYWCTSGSGTWKDISSIHNNSAPLKWINDICTEIKSELKINFIPKAHVLQIFSLFLYFPTVKRLSFMSRWRYAH